MRQSEVPGVLARHGIDPDAGAEALAAALLGRGWVVVAVEDDAVPLSRRRWRWRALATRPRPGSDPRRVRLADHVQGRGRTEAEALAWVLARALVYDEGP